MVQYLQFRYLKWPLIWQRDWKLEAQWGNSLAHSQPRNPCRQLCNCRLTLPQTTKFAKHGYKMAQRKRKKSPYAVCMGNPWFLWNTHDITWLLACKTKQHGNLLHLRRQSSNRWLSEGLSCVPPWGSHLWRSVAETKWVCVCVLVLTYHCHIYFIIIIHYYYSLFIIIIIHYYYSFWYSLWQMVTDILWQPLSMFTSGISRWSTGT